MLQSIKSCSHCRALVVLAIATFLAGCAGGPGPQLATCQQDKEQLLATIREQRDANLALRQEKDSLASRLDQAEKELASRTTGTRLSSRPGSPGKSSASSPAVVVESLPWRTPSGKVESANSDPEPTSVAR